MKYIFLTIFTVIIFSACSTKNTNIKTVEKVNLNKYLGTWYEIARYEHSFEKGCKNVKATYSLKEDNKIKVVNTCTKIKTNKTSDAIGSAYAVDETNSKLKVSFFWPFYGDYWIIMLDEDYSYAVVSEPKKEYLWILSRTKTLDKEVKENILKRLKSLNFDLSKLIWTIQE